MYFYSIRDLRTDSKNMWSNLRGGDEVAKFCHAILISGNLVHHPKVPDIISPAEFCLKFL